jgi:hypothetical protein
VVPPSVPAVRDGYLRPASPDLVPLNLVGRPTVDLLRTDSALCR